MSDLPQFNSELLVRLVASDSSAIVPVVSFNEIPHGDWRRVLELVASGVNGRANLVVCTHLDQLPTENMDEELRDLTQTPWPGGVLNTNRVIHCSPLMALSANDLLDRSILDKPPFEAIWDKDTLGYLVRGSLFAIPCVE
jgi:hypothetical protein